MGYFPSVAWETNGGFVVTWSSGPAQGDNVFARRFDSAGNGVGDPFQVNTNTPGHQYLSDVAMAGDGSFVVVWDSRAGPQDRDVFGQRFDRAGARIRDADRGTGLDRELGGDRRSGGHPQERRDRQ